MLQGPNDRAQELTSETLKSYSRSTQAAQGFEERCVREYSLGDTSSRQGVSSVILSTSGAPWRLPEITGGDCAKTCVSTIAPRSFVSWGCSSWGTSGLNREHSHVPFQGSHDSHLCFENFKGFWTLEIITGVLHFAEQSRELPVQLYFSSVVRVK